MLDLNVGWGGRVTAEGGMDGMQDLEQFVFECNGRAGGEVVIKTHSISGNDGLGVFC